MVEVYKRQKSPNPEEINDLQEEAYIEELHEAEKKKAEEEKGKELFPGDPDNRGRFEKLSDKTKEFAGGLFERAKIDIVDRAKVMFNDKLLGWHNEKAVLLKLKIEEKEREVERLEKSKSEHKERLETTQKELGPLSPKLLAKVELEKEQIQKSIDKEKERAEMFESKLDYRNEKKNVYESKRKRICEDVLEKVEKKLNPYDEKIEKLKKEQGQLDSEIEAFREKNKNYAGKMEILEKRMEASPFKTERKVYRTYLKELKKQIKENDKLINKTEKEEAKIGHRVAKFEKKAEPWRNKKTKFEALMGGKGKDEKIEEEPKLARQVGEPLKEKEGTKIEEKKAEELKRETKEKEAEKEEAEEVEKPTWSSISKKERKFWMSRFGKPNKAEDMFKRFQGDFEYFARYRENQKKYIQEWKEIREE